MKKIIEKWCAKFAAFYRKNPIVVVVVCFYTVDRLSEKESTEPVKSFEDSAFKRAMNIS